jgi:glycosyltransferase involved in cell wall biosynthesis
MTGRRDEEKPLLSVTVLNYNYAHYLAQCLDSILTQTFRDFELILINDRSMDNSLDVIEAFTRDARVRFINHGSNRGYVQSLLEGVELSRGKYITVISADDYCVSREAFARMIEVLESDDEVAFVYSGFRRDYAEQQSDEVYFPHEASHVRSGVEELRDFVAGFTILHSGTLIRRTAYDAIGGYDGGAKYSVDYKLWLALFSFGKVAYCAEELYAYRIHSASMNHSLQSARLSVLETLEGVENAVAALRDSLERPEDFRRQAIRSMVLRTPIYDVHGGRLRRAWYAYWVALRKYPSLTLFQRRTIDLALRTLLGGKAFHWVHDRKRNMETLWCSRARWLRLRGTL